jgi:aminobenzoyl-glutamate utilization protein B
MNARSRALGVLDSRAGDLIALGDLIWGFAETGFMETRSASALASFLEAEGFALERGVAGIASAFVASYGSGSPVIALLGEYDALPGLSQEKARYAKQEAVPGAPGHGCGHNLLGVGSLGAALAVKEALSALGLPGTVRYYGCPGEERGSGKTFMVRAGAFADVDLAFTWHPGEINTVLQARSLANLSVYFRFLGKASHAASAPFLGRSALDAVELMNVGANFLREHIIPEARLHYAISDPGGRAPNVVQDRAEVHYFCRAPRVSQAREIYERLLDVARGAALMTGTVLEPRFSEGLSDYLPNRALGELLQACLEESGRPAFSDADRELAARFRQTLTKAELGSALAQLRLGRGAEAARRLELDPLDEGISPLFPGEAMLPGSTDVGDVSQVVPTGQVITACTAFGTVPHSWQFTAQAASSIGHAGMLAAAKVLALASVDALSDPLLVERARAEHRERTGGAYECPIPPEINPEREYGSGVDAVT